MWYIGQIPALPRKHTHIDSANRNSNVQLFHFQWLTLFCAPGSVKFLPAVARLFCLAVPGSFLMYFAQNKVQLCRWLQKGDRTLAGGSGEIVRFRFLATRCRRHLRRLVAGKRQRHLTAGNANKENERSIITLEYSIRPRLQ